MATQKPDTTDKQTDSELDKILTAYKNGGRVFVKGKGYIDHKAEAVAALLRREAHIRIDELERLPRYAYPTENNIDREAIPSHIVADRIAELKAQEKGGQDSE